LALFLLKISKFGFLFLKFKALKAQFQIFDLMDKIQKASEINEKAQI
jgi:hypothetical protein